MVNPLVSVVIPTLNRGPLLVGAVRSVWEQTYRPVEVLVIDDCSEVPVSAESFQQFASEDFRIRVLRNQTRRGAAASRNTGVDLSSGEFFGFLDDDDVYYPEKLSKLASVLISDHKADAVFGRVRLTKGGIPQELFRIPDRFDKNANLAVMNMIHNNATLIRRSVAKKVRFFEPLARFQDMQYNIELTFLANVRYLPEYVAEWRVEARPDQITFDGGIEKTRKDIYSLSELLLYLLGASFVPKRFLGLFALKLAKMRFKSGEGVWKCASSLSQIGLLGILYVPVCLALRKKYFLS